MLQQAGIGVARHRLLTSSDDARRFAADAGLPVVLKPLGGSGGLATWCVRTSSDLDLALELIQPSPDSRVLCEEFLMGEELCIDAITIANEPQVYSICCYRPSILEALEQPAIQWSCVMPRDMSSRLYGEFIAQGLAGIRALAVGDGMIHMEGFLLEGGGVRFTDATLRPAGARIAPMLQFAYDADPYSAWARATVDGCFDGPWERRYAVGTLFLRGPGEGLVKDVQGMQGVMQRVGDLVVDGRLPRPGAARSATYTGDGYITVRHPETAAVEDAIEFIARTVRVVYTKPTSDQPTAEETRKQWKERLQYFNKLNRPAWDNDKLPTIGTTGRG